MYSEWNNNLKNAATETIISYSPLNFFRVPTKVNFLTEKSVWTEAKLWSLLLTSPASMYVSSFFFPHRKKYHLF